PTLFVGLLISPFPRAPALYRSQYSSLHRNEPPRCTRFTNPGSVDHVSRPGLWGLLLDFAHNNQDDKNQHTIPIRCPPCHTIHTHWVEKISPGPSFHSHPPRCFFVEIPLGKC